jgi:glycosyltransferase involved in cell wall biosynthesis
MGALKLLWIAQISKKNSFSKVSHDYVEMIRNLSDWDLRLFDISYDVPQIKMFEAIISFQPDYVVILHNDSDLRDISRRLLLIRDQWKGRFVAFTPIDSEGVGRSLLNFKCDLLLTMNGWAARQISSALSDCPVRVLEHVVEDVYQFSHRKTSLVRARLYGDALSKRFIVGVVNANNCRKRLDLAIEAFRLFHRQVSDSLLVLKTTKPEKGKISRVYDDLSLLAKDLPCLIFDDQCSATELNEFYCSFDLMINTTDGEGFGLTPFEGALAGTLSIVPYHSSFIALLPGKTRYCVDSISVPYEYARNCLDYLDYRQGRDRLLFYYGYLPLDGEVGSEVILSQVDRRDGATCYLLSLRRELRSDCCSSMESVHERVRSEHPRDFHILVSSDIESIRYYLEWSQRKSLQELINRGQQQYSVQSTSLLAINKYIGSDQPSVGIVDPGQVCRKMLYYYRHPEEKRRDAEDLQKHVQERFGSATIFSQLKGIFGGKNFLSKGYSTDNGQDHACHQACLSTLQTDRSDRPDRLARRETKRS